MVVKVYRYTYDGVGIYQAFKNIVGFNWKYIKNRPEISWLPVPEVYSDKSSKLASYFTKLGMAKFNKLTLPLMLKYLNKSLINIDELYVNTRDIKYKDKYQVVI